jgi:hypothetical protein
VPVAVHTCRDTATTLPLLHRAVLQDLDGELRQQHKLAVSEFDRTDAVLWWRRPVTRRVADSHPDLCRFP